MFIHDCEFRTIKNIEEKFKKFCWFADNTIRNDKYNYGSDILEFRKGKGMFDGFIYYMDFPVMYFDFYNKRFEILTMSNDTKSFAHYILGITTFNAEKNANITSLFSNFKRKNKYKSKAILDNHQNIMQTINIYDNISLLASKIFVKCVVDFAQDNTKILVREIELDKEVIEKAFNNIDLNKFTIYDSNITKDIIDYIYEMILKVKPL